MECREGRVTIKDIQRRTDRGVKNVHIIITSDVFVDGVSSVLM